MRFVAICSAGLRGNAGIDITVRMRNRRKVCCTRLRRQWALRLTLRLTQNRRPQILQATPTMLLVRLFHHSNSAGFCVHMAQCMLGVH